MEKWLLIGAGLCAVLGAVSDLRAGRIPNQLTYGGIAAGLVLRACLIGWGGMWDGLEAALLGGGIFFLFFLVRGMGAGDVKLMAAIGSLAGVGQSWVIIFATAIAGGILAVGYMIFYKRFARTLANVGALLRFHLTSGLQPHPEVSLKNPEAIRMPYALAIAAGTFYSLGKIFLRV